MDFGTIYDCSNVDFINIGDEIHSLNNNLYKIDDNKTIYSELEQFINCCVKYHLIRLNLAIDGIYSIDFSLLDNKSNKLTTIYDKHYYDKFNKHNRPSFSIAASFGDDVSQLIVTDVNCEQYKFKDFDCQKSISLFMLKKYQHICLDPGKYHGCSNILNTLCDNSTQTSLLINVWKVDSHDKTITYHSDVSSVEHLNIAFESKKYETTINCYNGSKHDFFENLLYKNNCELQPESIVTTSLYKVIMTHNDVTNSAKKQDVIVGDKSRFSQVFNYPDVMPAWMCKWFTSEFNSIRNNNDSIDIETIPNIYTFFLQMFPRFFEEINAFYSINPTDVSIQEIKVCKLSNHKVNSNSVNHDENASLYICICINNSNNGDGCLLVNGIHRVKLCMGSMTATSIVNNTISFDNINGDEICMLIRVTLSDIVYSSISIE